MQFAALQQIAPSEQVQPARSGDSAAVLLPFLIHQFLDP